MKRLIMILFVTLSIIISGCTSKESFNDNYVNNETEIVAPTLPDTEQPEIKEPNIEEEIVDIKKKSYIVSTTNSLRVRTAPNSSSNVLGYLDKDDAVIYIDRINGFYKTIFKETIAYIHSSYCTIMEIEYTNDAVETAIDTGCSLLGYPYVWGSQRYHWGNGKLNSNFINGEFDCSALVQYIYYKSNNVILDVTTRTQINNGVEIDKNDLARGDLMFFTNSSRKNKTGVEKIGHVGIYFGNNYILHTASDHAVIEPISTLRWSYYITARRVI